MKSALAPKLSVGGDLSGIQVGADVDIGLNVLNSKKSIWGQKSLDVAGWTVKAKAEYSEGKYNYPDDSGRGVYLSVEANDEGKSSFAWVSGDVCASGVQPLKVGGKKIVSTPGGKFMVEPRYNFANNGADVCLGYEREADDSDTRVYLTVSKNDQNVKIVQTVNDDLTASVKVGTSSGFMYAKLQKKSSAGGSTVTLTSDNLDLQLNQDGWTAGMSLPYPYWQSEPQVRFSKKFSLSQ